MGTRYFDLLNRERTFYDVSKIYFSFEKEEDVFENISRSVTAPSIYMFTCWIISRAEKLGLKRLYFFSRDGYYMHQAAEKICKRRNNGIKCSYFFCSRYSLRMGAYRFKDDSAYDELFYFAYKISPYILLRRADFSDEERKMTYENTGFDGDEKKIMTKHDFSEFCSLLKKSDVFEKLLMEKSDASYEGIKAYIIQEEMTSYDKIGVVDLGWNGSMQYTLRKILDSMGSDVSVFGFYLGMMSFPHQNEKNNYFSWLFQKNDYKTRSWFSHNLLECLCSAPHGMTLKYILNKNSDSVSVVFDKHTGSKRSDVMLTEELKILSENCDTDYYDSFKKTALRLLYLLMYKPEPKEADSLSGILFCDDVAEQYHGALVVRSRKKDLLKEIFPFKIFNRKSADGFYWYFGSVAVSLVRAGGIYRFGYRITRYLLSGLR